MTNTVARSAAAILTLAVSSAVFGYTVGYAHSDLYAARNLVKFPLLMLGTGVVCGVAYWVTAAFLGAFPGFRRVSGLVVELFRDAAILLASLAPANALVAWRMHHDPDPRLGEYPLILGLDVLFIAVAGAVALVSKSREMLEKHGIVRARCIVTAWLLLSLVVGGQLAFWMRPFFGLPASRGGHPPFVVGAEPDCRGATNFYEAMLQIVTDPPVPSDFGSAGSAR